MIKNKQTKTKTHSHRRQHNQATQTHLTLLCPFVKFSVVGAPNGKGTMNIRVSVIFNTDSINIW